MNITPEEIELIKNRIINKAILKDGSTVRIFSSNGVICQFKKGSRKYGYYLDLNNIERLIKSNKVEKTPDEKNYKMIAKFRKEAMKASFTNDFIRDCQALPETFEQWVADGKKSPYEYGITTGCKITGELISVETLSKLIRSGDALKQAIKNKHGFRSGYFRLYGYDGSLSIETDENGEIRGFLNKEYKGTGNGYYYLLINDDYFIGYDVD